MKPYWQNKGVTLYQAECLEAMRLIPDGSVDACITDPPYGTTACSWDAVIPFAPMWAELKRIVKKNGAIVLFGSQPFTSALVMSNPQMFKYQWTWHKSQTTNYLNAAKQPLRRTEDICVFYREQCLFNPQMKKVKERFVTRTGGYSTEGKGYGAHRAISGSNNGEECPFGDIWFSSETGIHETQKPVELVRYLVRTYTNEGDTVLDFTCGSGTTGVACAIERREFIGIEQDAHYCGVSEARIKRAQGIACDMPKRVKQYAPTPLFEAVA